MTNDSNYMHISHGPFHVGQRSIKTAVAATLCALPYLIFGADPSFACIGAIFGLGSDMSMSKLNGGNRFFPSPCQRNKSGFDPLLSGVVFCLAGKSAGSIQYAFRHPESGLFTRRTPSCGSQALERHHPDHANASANALNFRKFFRFPLNNRKIRCIFIRMYI